MTAYNIAYKYFNILNMAMMIIVTPFWSACADAYTKKDFLWMKNVIEKMEMIWKLSICVLIIMILVSSTFYDIWVGDSVKISLSLSVMVGVYILVQNLCGIYIYDKWNKQNPIAVGRLFGICFYFCSDNVLFVF